MTKKYEYKELIFYGINLTINSISGKISIKLDDAKSSRMIKLNEYGSNGWEIISYRNYDTTEFYLLKKEYK